MAKCTNCGAEFQEDAKFCMECGEKVAKKKFCSQCGTELPNEAKFCLECGAKISVNAKVSSELLEIFDKSVNEKDSFLMPIEDIFTISGRGTVVTGKVERGTINMNDTVEIVGIRPTQTSIVTGIEMFNKLLDSAIAGDNVGIFLRGIDKKVLKEVKFSPNLAQFFRTANSKHKLMFCLHQRAVVKPRFSAVIVRSSISAKQTFLVR